MTGAVLLSLAGCAPAPKRAILLATDFSPQQIGTITVLPALDERIATDVEVDLARQLGLDAVTALQERGYNAVFSSDSADASNLTLDELRDATPDAIQRLGSPAARWVMLLALLDVATTLSFGSTGIAEVAGFLFDTRRGVLLWRDKGVGQVEHRGPLGMALIANKDEAAIARALLHLFASLPERDPVRAAARAADGRDFD